MYANTIDNYRENYFKFFNSIALTKFESKELIKLNNDEIDKFRFLSLHKNSDIHHYNQRSMVERVNAYLKDSFGCNKIYYKGASKVENVLAFGILSICIHQSIKLLT